MKYKRNIFDGTPWDERPEVIAEREQDRQKRIEHNRRYAERLGISEEEFYKRLDGDR